VNVRRPRVCTTDSGNPATMFLNLSEIFGKYGIVNQLILIILLLFSSFMCVLLRLLTKIFSLKLIVSNIK